MPKEDLSLDNKKCFDRNVPLDFLKAVGILMVVLIHSFSLVFRKPSDSLLYVLCCLLADPFFFFVSGYLISFKRYEEKGFLRFVKHQFFLIFFFVLFALLKMLIHLGINDISFFDFFIYPHNGLWFLFSLFVLRWLAFIARFFARFIPVKKNFHINLLLQLLIFVILLSVPFSIYYFFGDIFDFGHTFVYSFFFVAGWVISCYSNALLKSKEMLMHVACLVLFLLFCLLLYFFFKNDWLKNFSPLVLLFRLLLSTTGVFFFFLLLSIIGDKPFFWFSKLGRYSLGIYFVSSLIIEFSNIHLGLFNRTHDDDYGRLFCYSLLIAFVSVVISFLAYRLLRLIKTKQQVDCLIK